MVKRKRRAKKVNVAKVLEFANTVYKVVREVVTVLFLLAGIMFFVNVGNLAGLYLQAILSMMR